MLKSISIFGSRKDLFTHQRKKQKTLVAADRRTSISTEAPPVVQARKRAKTKENILPQIPETMSAITQELLIQTLPLIAKKEASVKHDHRETLAEDDGTTQSSSHRIKHCPGKSHPQEQLKNAANRAILETGSDDELEALMDKIAIDPFSTSQQENQLPGIMSVPKEDWEMRFPVSAIMKFVL